MSTPAFEVEPDFYLQVVWKGSISARQIAILRRVGPGLSDVPAQSLIRLWRQAQEVTLGPYYKKYQAEHAKSELCGVGLIAKLLTR
jgi:hypothetical protein